MIIALLAAISVVAYNGITSRAQDSLVASELGQAARKLEVFHATHGRYPLNATELTTVIEPKIGGNYDMHSDTYNYCYDLLSDRAGISVQGAKGTAYIIKGGGVTTRSTWRTNSVAACNDTDKINIPVTPGSRRVS